MDRAMMRWLIDVTMLAGVYLLAHRAFGDWRISLACQAVVGAYGCWCFYDGAGRP